MGICGKSCLGYEMCEHLNMVERLNTLFPETIMLSESVLQSLSNDSEIGTRCLKPETIEKCKEINNLAIANEKWPVVAFDNEDNVHIMRIMRIMCTCQYLLQKFITARNLSLLQ